MTRRIENPDRARKPLTLGIRAALLLSLAALVALMTAGALVVGYVERHLAVEECADAVVRGGLDRMEAELDGLLGPVYDRVHTVRDWTMRRTLPLRDPTAMFHTLQPLIESTPIVRGVMFYSNEASFSLRRDDGGWVSRARRLDEDLDVAVAYWDDRGNLIREEHEAPSSAPPTGEPLFREALVRCRARGDQDGAGRVDICWELPGAEGPDAALRLAFAVGPGPRETAVSFELDLARFAEAIVGIHPTPAGYAVALHESGRVLGLTGWRYAAATASPVLEEIAPSGIGRAYAYWASDVNQGTRPFATDAADTTWWCAFRRMSSRKDAPFVFGVAAPQPDLLFAARQGRDYLLLVGLWGMVAAGALAFVLAAAVRRPVRRFVEHVQRYDALEPADNYWPRSRVTEVRSLTDALDELCRQAAARAPAAAVSRTTDVIPDAQLQALFTARKQMRDARARLEDLRARLRGQEAADAETARRAREQRALLRDLVCSPDIREDDPRKAAALLAEAAARSLDVARAAVWRLDDDGVLTCLDRYDASAQAHAAGMLFSRAEFPELFDAVGGNPAFAIPDVNGDRWTRRLAAAIGGAPAATAIIACAIREDARIVALLLCEHTGGPREWTEDEKDQAIILAHVLAPARIGGLSAASPTRDTLVAAAGAQLDAAPVVLWTTDAIGCVTYVSGAIERLYGYAREELLGRPFAMLSAEDDGAARLEVVADETDDAALRSYVSTHRRKNGETMDVRVASAPLRNPEGACVGRVGVIEAVDEAARLAEVGHLLRFLAARDEHLLLAVDRSGRVLWLTLSPSLEDRLEVVLREAAGSSLHDLLRSWRAAEQQETFFETLRTCAVRDAVFAAQFPGGSYEFEATFIPLPERGEVARVLVCMRDVTLGGART